MSKLGDNYTPHAGLTVESLPFSCRWILSVLNKAINKTISSLEKYEFSEASTAVYDWWQYELCDVFIEVIKPYFNGDDPKFDSERGAARDTLWVCLDNGLRLLHPFMPFVTEELWQRLPKPPGSFLKESIMISPYPSVVEEWTSEESKLEMDLVKGTVKCLRSLRSQLPPEKRNERRPGFAVSRNNEIAEIIKKRTLEISALASLSSFEVLGENDEALSECGVEVVNGHLSAYFQLKGALNAEAELEKRKKKRDELQKQHDTLKKKMSAAGYKEKVPEQIRKEYDAKLEKLSRELALLEEANQNLESIIVENR